MLADVLDEVQPEDTFYDVGANLGVYSVMTSCNGTASVAIEPYPPNVERLRNNIAENDTEVEVVESAVGADSGSVAFEIEDTEEIGSVGIASGQESTERETINVPMNTLDAISRNLDAPDVIKIDVEGAEGLVLDGAHKTLEDCRTTYLEIHVENAYGSSTHDFGYSPDDICSLLEDHGFQIKIIKDKTNQKIIKAE